jgi:hypothetical protein
MSLPTDRLTNDRAMVHPYASIACSTDSQATMQQILAQAPSDVQLHCRYRSKTCLNPRAHKRDGSLHRYCEDHRQRANTNQKLWAKRRMHESDQPVAHRTDALATIHDAELLALWAECDEEPDSPLFTDEADFELLWQALSAGNVDKGDGTLQLQ